MQQQSLVNQNQVVALEVANEQIQERDYSGQAEEYTGKLGILKLNKNLIELVLMCCSDIGELSKNREVCGTFAAIVNQHVTEVKFENKTLLPGKENMNESYLLMDIPKNIRHLLEVRVTVWSKDQGEDKSRQQQQSSSWITLDILDQNNKQIDYNQVAQNRKCVDFKKYCVPIIASHYPVFCSNIDGVQLDSNGSRDLNAAKSDSKAVKLELRAHSETQGWVCHVKKATVILYYTQQD